MKLSEFTAKDTDFRPQSTQILAFNNEAKESQLASKIAELEQKLASIEHIAEERTRLSATVESQQRETEGFIQKQAESELKISTLEASLQEKERFLGDLESFRQQNSNLLLDHGEMMSRMNELRFDSGQMHEELEQLRTNNGGLEVARRSLSTELLNKEALIKEVTTTITDVKEQYEDLVASSSHVAKQYTDITEKNLQLDKNNLQLTSQVAVLQQQQQELENSHKKDRVGYGKAIEERVKGVTNRQVEELQHDVDDLIKMNTYYKSELSKPQHMSIGAIARQEQFKLPLASNAINYRTNNLGTAQPTLLKFSSREVTNDH